MAEENAVVADAKMKEQVTLTHVIYGLYGAQLVFPFAAIVAIVLNYIKREEVAGTFLESHFRWQIRTFWFSILWGVIGFILAFVIVGFAILFADLVWYIYRITKGWLKLNEMKPIDVTPPPATGAP